MCCGVGLSDLLGAVKRAMLSLGCTWVPLAAPLAALGESEGAATGIVVGRMKLNQMLQWDESVRGKEDGQVSRMKRRERSWVIAEEGAG